MLDSAVAGLLTGLTLIIAIGAQNAFVLRQGLAREHVLPVVAICAVSDLLLILAGVAGIGTVIRQAGWVIEVVRWLGVAFLTWYGVRTLLGRRLDARIEDAAKELGVSERSLQRWLNQRGLSFHDEVVAARLAVACELLQTTDLKVAAIAARLGISERAVTMLFRSQTGLTPMAWRAQRRG